jgi:hypothetical protein
VNTRPASWIDQLVGACVSLLIAAVALYAAVHLLATVWLTLIAILGGVAVLGGAFAAWRSWQRRRTGW